jgi:beta-glucanase (GH16 family)
VAARARAGLLVAIGCLAITLIALGRVIDDSEGDLAPLPDGARLILREDFGGRRLDAATWSTCYWWARGGCTIASNNELEWYLPGQVRVGGGHARLRAEPRTTISPDGDRYRYASGMLTTGPRSSSSSAPFAFTYGRASIRMRAPVGRGLWSAFWLLPSDRESRPEVDVVEIYGHEPRVARMNIHLENNDGEDIDRGRRWRAGALAGEWHTYAVDWRPGALTWLIDGRIRWKVTGDAVPSEPMYPIVNLAVGGDPVGPPGRDVLPAELLVDSVRVFAFPETTVER